MLPESENSSVPWTGLDVLLFLALWFAAMLVAATVVHGASPAPPPVHEAADHPIVQLIRQGKELSPVLLIVPFLSVVVVAPLIEEFVCRLLLQGWLEAKLLQYRIPSASGVAIVAVSLFFASLHAGKQSSGDTQAFFYGLIISMLLCLAIFAGGMLYLVRKRDVKFIPCVFGTGRFFHAQFPSRLGYCLLAIFLIFGIATLLVAVIPIDTVRPIVIFLFALLLGTLYSLTKNLAYCILLHAFWNGTLFAMFLFAA